MGTTQENIQVQEVPNPCMPEQNHKGPQLVGKGERKGVAMDALETK